MLKLLNKIPVLKFLTVPVLAGAHIVVDATQAGVNIIVDGVQVLVIRGALDGLQAILGL